MPRLQSQAERGWEVVEQTHFRLTLRDENGEKIPGPVFSIAGNWMDAEITDVERWYHVSIPSEPIDLGDWDGKA
jgi:hypothetical protein